VTVADDFAAALVGLRPPDAAAKSQEAPHSHNPAGIHLNPAGHCLNNRGHLNVPIHTLQYPSNWHLSEARAKAVAARLTELTGPGVIEVQGRVDTDPIGDNASPEGREANRRTEILVYGAAERAYLKPPEESPTTP